jgi:hypothetical protein
MMIRRSTPDWRSVNGTTTRAPLLNTVGPHQISRVDRSIKPGLAYPRIVSSVRIFRGPRVSKIDWILTVLLCLQPPEEREAAFSRLAARPPVTSWLQGTEIDASGLFRQHGLRWSLPEAPGPGQSEAPPPLTRINSRHSMHRASTQKGVALAFLYSNYPIINI